MCVWTGSGRATGKGCRRLALLHQPTVQIGRRPGQSQGEERGPPYDERTIQDIRQRSAVLYCPFPAKKQEFYDRQGYWLREKPSGLYIDISQYTGPSPEPLRAGTIQFAGPMRSQQHKVNISFDLSHRFGKLHRN